MKIGILIDRIAPGSAPKVIGNGVKGLRALGHDAEAVVIVNGYPAETYEFHMGGVPIRCLMNEYPALARQLDFRFPGFSYFSLHHLSSGVLAPRVIREGEWDVLIVHSTYTCFTARALFRQRHIPYIPFIWDPVSYILPKVYRKRSLGRLFPILLPMARWTDKYILEDARAVITSGRLHHERMRQFTQRPLEILYPGCFPLKSIPRWDDREDLILTFDRWDIGNTPNQFLDMLARVRAPVKLVVGGHWYPESLKEEFMREAARRGLIDRIIIEGALNEAKIQAWAQRVKMHLHPNEEAFGMQCLEAAACGCPIVVPAGSGVTELFEHGVHGFFPPSDPRDQFRGDMRLYAEYVDEVLLNPAKGAAMSQAAFEAARAWTWERHAQRLEEIIRRHADGQGLE